MMIFDLMIIYLNSIYLQKMTFFMQTRTSPYQSHQNEKTSPPQHEILELAIEQELQRCSQIYSTRMQGIIEEWKRFTLQNYREILDKVNCSLTDEVNKIIFEQINIEKEQILQIINQIGIDLLAKHKNTPKQETSKAKHQFNESSKSKQKSHSLVKTRSISGQNPRRKLSRGSFFAEAKKINMNQSSNSRGFAKTNPLSGFNNTEKDGGKVKKTRKKEENCFDILQKFNKTTSPSNIMINYIHAKELINSHSQQSQQKPQQKYTIQIKQAKQNSEANIEKLITPLQNSIKTQSQTYKKLMNSFQDKISKKLDILMDKYTKIQQKLQTNPLQKKQSVIIHTNNRDSQTNTQNIVSIQASLINLPEKSCYYTQKQKKTQQKQNSFLESTKIKRKQVQESKIISRKQVQLSKKSVKAVEHHNKIIKNKSNFEDFSQSIQEISLQKKKTNQDTRLSQQKSRQKPLKMPKQQQKPLKQHQALSNQKWQKQQNKQYLQTLILEFNAIAQKVILPISKQLLYVLVYRYQHYCQLNSTTSLSKEVMGLQTKRLQSFEAEFIDLLNKIQKVIGSKCEPSRKEKLIIYFSKFIQAVSSYDTTNNTVSKEEEQHTEQELKDKINNIKSSLPQ